MKEEYLYRAVDASIPVEASTLITYKPRGWCRCLDRYRRQPGNAVLKQTEKNTHKQRNEKGHGRV